MSFFKCLWKSSVCLLRLVRSLYSIITKLNLQFWTFSCLNDKIDTLSDFLLDFFIYDKIIDWFQFSFALKLISLFKFLSLFIQIDKSSLVKKEERLRVLRDQVHDVLEALLVGVDDDPNFTGHAAEYGLDKH